MPDVATLAELGLPDAEYKFWVGAFVPAKTPKPIVERLNREIVAALKVKEVGRQDPRARRRRRCR